MVGRPRRVRVVREVGVDLDRDVEPRRARRPAALTWKPPAGACRPSTPEGSASPAGLRAEGGLHGLDAVGHRAGAPPLAAGRHQRPITGMAFLRNSCRSASMRATRASRRRLGVVGRDRRDVVPALEPRAGRGAPEPPRSTPIATTPGAAERTSASVSACGRKEPRRSRRPQGLDDRGGTEASGTVPRETARTSRPRSFGHPLEERRRHQALGRPVLTDEDDGPAARARLCPPRRGRARPAGCPRTPGAPRSAAARAPACRRVSDQERPERDGHRGAGRRSRAGRARRPRRRSRRWPPR